MTDKSDKNQKEETKPAEQPTEPEAKPEERSQYWGKGGFECN